MGKDSHIVHNFGNLLGKCSHDIHNVGIRKKATLSPKSPNYYILGVNSFPKISQMWNSMSQFFPVIGNFPIYFPTGDFEKFPVKLALLRNIYKVLFRVANKAACLTVNTY